MGQDKNEKDKKRELVACQWVADEMNNAHGTDYHAERVEVRLQWPDVRLVSDSGKYRAREVEVVRTPQDFTILPDNKNLQEFERRLRAALMACGVSGCLIDVAWTKEAVRYGLKHCQTTITELANIIAKEIAGTHEHGHVRIGKSAFRDPGVYNAVDFVSAVCVRQPILQVTSCDGVMLPPDGRWIEEAIRKKSGKYDPGVVRDSILVVDGFPFIEWEQVAAFRASHSPAQLPYCEIWVVTVSGPCTVKP